MKRAIYWLSGSSTNAGVFNRFSVPDFLQHLQEEGMNPETTNVMVDVDQDQDGCVTGIKLHCTDEVGLEESTTAELEAQSQVAALVEVARAHWKACARGAPAAERVPLLDALASLISDLSPAAQQRDEELVAKGKRAERDELVMLFGGQPGDSVAQTVRNYIDAEQDRRTTSAYSALAILRKQAKRLRMLDENATPDPWEWDDARPRDEDDEPGPDYIPQCSHIGDTLIGMDDTYEGGDYDAALIVEMRNMLPTLLDAIDALDGSDLESACNYLDKHCGASEIRHHVGQSLADAIRESAKRLGWLDTER